MDTAKQTHRNVETETKKALRDADRHDVGDDRGNLGDEVRKDLGSAGEVRKDLGNAGDEILRHTDTPRA
jgi:hypothetical protein